MLTGVGWETGTWQDKEAGLLLGSCWSLMWALGSVRFQNVLIWRLKGAWRTWVWCPGVRHGFSGYLETAVGRPRVT